MLGLVSILAQAKTYNIFENIGIFRTIHILPERGAEGLFKNGNHVKNNNSSYYIVLHGMIDISKVIFIRKPSHLLLQNV